MNKFDFLGIKEVIDNLKKAEEQASSSLDIMDNTIKDSVGVDGYAWRGEEANNFRNSWDQLSKDIREYKKILNEQIISIENILDKMKES